MPRVNRNRKLRKTVTANCIARQERVAKLYCEGKSQREIGEIEGVTQQLISLDLKVMRERWKERADASYDQKVQEELAKIDALEKEAHAGYARSKKGSVMFVTDPKTQESKKIEGPEKPGDTRFLDSIKWCIETRLKLVGLLDTRPINFNNNNNTAAADFSLLFARKDDPQLAEKRAPVIPPVDDPLDREIKRLEQQASEVQ